MAQFPNAMLLCASSPYARKGALFDAHQRHYGKDHDPVLVWKAPTRTMNPTVSQSVVDAAMARDASDAAAEWMAEFRSDLESFISRETVLACIEPGVQERPPQSGVRYWSFIDPSGGSSDSMTCAIGHLENDHVVVVDCVREITAPFDPESAVDEFVQLLLRYGVRETNGDRYAAQWVTTALEKRGIVGYRHCELPRSALYLNLLLISTQGRFACSTMHALLIRSVHWNVVPRVAHVTRSIILAISMTILPTRSPVWPTARRSDRRYQRCILAVTRTHSAATVWRKSASANAFSPCARKPRVEFGLRRAPLHPKSCAQLGRATR